MQGEGIQAAGTAVRPVITRSDDDRTAWLTLAERFIEAFRLPYGLGCVVVGSVLFGLLNALVAAVMETSSVPKALGIAFSAQSLAQDALFAYAFYAPRYMRTRLRETEESLNALMPDEEEGLRRSFGAISSIRPQVVTWALFLVALVIAVNAPAILGGPSTFVVNVDPGFSFLEFFGSIFQVVSLAVVTLGLSSVVWTYYSITTGIRRFSSAPLRLRPHYEDPFLGLKPVGSLALSLATVYFGLIALFLLSLFTSATAPTTADVVGVGSFLLASLSWASSCSSFR